MKKLILFYFTVLSLFANTDAKESLKDKNYLIKEYQEMFQKISQKRVGLSDSEIAQVKTPFIKMAKKKGIKSANKVQKKETLVLEAILGNRVMINGKWYKLYQNVGNLKIISISENSVYLKGFGTKQKLTIRTKNENITIK